MEEKELLRAYLDIKDNNIVYTILVASTLYYQHVQFKKLEQ